ncbi:helix-turn-helix domain-containing protein [Pseudalkalibacillus sp. Hm43]|uniref:helix-turn-helix domain-containing protein n=1 Tax=Pseudalkalibacillus sp. Hm43 TaxID=3450742 RepID=UPI003F43C287
MKIHGVYHDVEPTWSTEQSRGLNTLVYVTDGKVRYSLDGKTVVLEKGDFLYIPSNVYRSWKNDVNISHKKYTVVFSWEGHAPDGLEIITEQKEVSSFEPRHTAYFEQRFAFLFVQWLGRRTCYEMLACNVITELLLLVHQEKTERNASPIKEQIVRKMQEYVLHHFRRNITIEELASIAEVTPNYVTILFKEVIGVTPIQYLHQIRINTAWNLLSDTRMSIREVAEYLGYCDQSYFNRMFKKWMGTAPSKVKTNPIE